MNRKSMIEKLIEAIAERELTRENLSEEAKLAFGKWAVEQSIQARMAAKLEKNDELFFAAEALTSAAVALLTIDPDKIKQVFGKQTSSDAEV